MARQLRINLLLSGRTIWMVCLSFYGAILLGQPVDDQYLQGSAFALKGEYQNAIEQYSQVIYRNNADENLFLKRGAVYLNMGKFNEALTDFNEANEINPHLADIWIARVYSMEGNAELAVQFLKSHLTSPFRLQEDSIKRDIAFDRIQETAAWFALWENDWYDNTEKILSEADRYVKRKQYEKAIAFIDDQLASESDYRLLVIRGKAFMGQQNFAAAAGDFSSALNIQKQIPGLFAQRGHAFLKTGRAKEAVSDFTKALKEDPADFSLYPLRAQAYANLKNWTSAIKDMQMVLKYFEEDMNAVFVCGTYYYEAADYINALKCFNRNLKDDPNHSEYYKARGKTYYKTGTYRYSINDLSMSLDLNPNDAEVWMYYGIASIKSGDKDTGCSSLKKSKDLGNTEVLQYIIDFCQ